MHKSSQLHEEKMTDSFNSGQQGSSEKLLSNIKHLLFTKLYSSTASGSGSGSCTAPVPGLSAMNPDPSNLGNPTRVTQPSGLTSGFKPGFKEHKFPILRADPGSPLVPVPGNFEDISSDEGINMELKIVGQENIRYTVHTELIINTLFHNSVSDPYHFGIQFKIEKGDGGDVAFDRGGGGVPVFVYGSIFEIFWVHA